MEESTEFHMQIFLLSHDPLRSIPYDPGIDSLEKTPTIEEEVRLLKLQFNKSEALPMAQLSRDSPISLYNKRGKDGLTRVGSELMESEMQDLMDAADRQGFTNVQLHIAWSELHIAWSELRVPWPPELHQKPTWDWIDYLETLYSKLISLRTRKVERGELSQGRNGEGESDLGVRDLDDQQRNSLQALPSLAHQ